MAGGGEKQLKEQAAVVTGAGHGIGAAIAHKLAGLGATTVLCWARPKPLEAEAAAISVAEARSCCGRR